MLLQPQKVLLPSLGMVSEVKCCDILVRVLALEVIQLKLQYCVQLYFCYCEQLSADISELSWLSAAWVFHGEDHFVHLFGNFVFFDWR